MVLPLLLTGEEVHMLCGQFIDEDGLKLLENLDWGGLGTLGLGF